jgi:hypothetical protein
MVRSVQLPTDRYLMVLVITLVGDTKRRCQNFFAGRMILGWERWNEFS